MSKAILVLNEMPENCGCCPLSNIDGKMIFEAQIHCSITGDSEDFYHKPKNCPLKSLPKKKQVDKNSSNDKTYELICLGYNACIDEMLKAYAEISGFDLETAIKEIEKSLKEEEVRKYVDQIKAQIIKTIDKK